MEAREWARWWRQLGQAQLRALLMEEWNPIGIDDAYVEPTEYDSYLNGIVTRLRNGADVNELAIYLSSLVTERMGIASTPSQEAEAARAILRWWFESPRPT